MRILLLTTSLHSGGASVACRRTYEALSSCGAEVRVLQLTKITSDKDPNIDGITTVYQTKILQALERLHILRRNGLSFQQLFRYSSARYGHNITNHPWVQWADIIHIHWINHGMLNLQGIRELIALSKPILWTLHDLWPILGGCHLPFIWHNDYLELCSRITLGCGSCPLLSNHKREDLSRELVLQKESWWQKNLHLICVSKAESYLLNHLRSGRHIPQDSIIANPLNADKFCIRSISEERLPIWYQKDRKYLLVVSSRLDDKVKGPHLLRKVLEDFCRLAPIQASNTSIILVGYEKQTKTLANLPIETIRLGVVREEETLIDLYNLCDIVLSTSLYETFGQTLSEAIACGATAISFHSYGAEDIIIPDINGDLVPSYDTEAMAKRISYRLTPQGNIPRPKCQASGQRFSYQHIGQELLALYKKVSISTTNTIDE